MQLVMKLGLVLDESTKTVDSGDVYSWVTPPLILELQSFECWQDLGNVKTGFNLGAHIFWSDYAIMTELTPKGNTCSPLYVVMISTLLVTPHTDLGQSSFEIDYLRIIIKDVNMGRNSITGGNPVWNWLPIIMKDANAPHPFLAQKIYLIQLLLLGPFWTKTVATWQSSALPSAWITTFLSIASWSSWEDGAHQEGSEENLSHCSQPSC